MMKNKGGEMQATSGGVGALIGGGPIGDNEEKKV
jgi:hypothetical protein